MTPNPTTDPTSGDAGSAPDGGLSKRERGRRRAQERATRPRRPRRPTAPDGLLVVDKPGGWTSHDVVAHVRHLDGTRKVGHAGTLDPMATGVLVVAVGRATRLLSHLDLDAKSY